MLNLINKVLNNFRLQLIKTNKSNELPIDFDSLHKNIWSSIQNYTMTSPERVFSLIESVKYISNNQIEGAIVECGVWKGGSMMAVIETLKHLNMSNRELYLYDTFEGMSEPTENDVDHAQKPAAEQLAQRIKNETDVVWAFSPLEAVQKVVLDTGYPKNQIHFIKGKVEETIPNRIPGKIALLRLDTDWYESTKHELNHLFPLLAKGGILIIDDYGHWAGAKKAVDEYFLNLNEKYFMHRIDNTGRLIVKK
jgi:hypothetical protein